MDNKKFLYDYINAYSPVSQEWSGQKIWSEYLKTYVDELHSDNYGNIYGIILSKSANIQHYKVVIESHSDEIAFIITHIDTNGLIYVTKFGGSDAAIAPSKSVVIHTRKNGMIRGVFGFTSIHIRESKDKSVNLKDLFIDSGLDSFDNVKEAGVEVGNLVTFEESFSELGNYYCGKSLDNKIGGYIIAEVARRIKENKIDLPYDLYIVNTVQEEVGLLGSQLIANQIKPNVALVHDVTHHTNTPGINIKEHCDIKCGKGPVIEYASQNHRLLIDYIRDIADKNEIKYQLENGSQGNNTMSFFKAGCVTSIISSPLKYMHTTVEMVHKKDVENIINLFYKILINMECRGWKYYEF